ncbi:MAG: hypothetical protein K2F58_04530, partial [Muribaculaceae bacterium]|nr:hypothetical protein [Muribaculaceae bacterium]
GGVNVSAIGAGSTAIGTDNALTVTGGVTYAFGRTNGVKAMTAEVAGGVFICGGMVNTAAAGATKSTYGALEADEVTVIKDDAGSVLGGFRWPVAMTTASLLYRF